jgi:trimethylamine--corrinoid protein Co-methyltransferase
MTAPLHPAEPVLATDRTRRGGRAGKRASGAAAF